MNQDKLHQLVGQAVTELGAAVTGVTVIVGDKLGLYKRLAEKGPLTSAQLAKETGTAERYCREWLSVQAASGFVTYDAGTGAFSMSPEQQAILADEESPFFLAGGFYELESIYGDEARLSDAFRSGKGLGWGDHTACLFCGTERFFKPGYKANLVSQWLPALDGVVGKLEKGGAAADVGCGHGVSTIIMAQAFPNSQFHGFDFHEPSIQRARQLASEAGVKNVNFEVATAKNFDGGKYDLVACFDCLHDMGDPAGAAAHVREMLKPDGTWMIVEPLAGDRLEENLNPVGRIYYAFSTSVCVPASLDQEVGTALGAQAGEARLREVVQQGGFTRFRRATQTPFNMVLEARP